MNNPQDTVTKDSIIIRQKTVCWRNYSIKVYGNLWINWSPPHTTVAEIKYIRLRVSFGPCKLSVLF